MARLQREEAALRAANGQSRADLTRVYAMAQRQQQKMEELEQCLLDTRQQLREKDEEIRKDNENMARLKAQLEAIAESLDENNASRQMLLNLISQTFWCAATTPTVINVALQTNYRSMSGKQRALIMSGCNATKITAQYMHAW